MPARGHARAIAPTRRRFARALRPFLAHHDSPIELRAWPGPTRIAIVCAKESLARQWDHEGWIPRGVLLVTFRSIHPAGGLRPALAAMAAATNRAVFIGDLDPVDLASYVILESAAPRGLSLLYGGIDDEWLLKEKASRTSPEATPYVRMPETERRLWRALLGAHPAIEATIGSGARRLLDRGLKLELEGACNLGWHGRTMCKFALRRALASGPRSGQPSGRAERSIPSTRSCT